MKLLNLFKRPIVFWIELTQETVDMMKKMKYKNT